MGIYLVGFYSLYACNTSIIEILFAGTYLLKSRVLVGDIIEGLTVDVYRLCLIASQNIILNKEIYIVLSSALRKMGIARLIGDNYFC